MKIIMANNLPNFIAGAQIKLVNELNNSDVDTTSGGRRIARDVASDESRPPSRLLNSNGGDQGED